MSPDGVDFQHVSPKLATLRLGNALALCGALCGAISGLVLIVDIPALWWLMLVPAAIALFCLGLVPAQVRALRYALADTDFVIRRGVFSRSLTLVPYGRIQYVDIYQGPVLRLLGISTIKLSTASAKTDATLSGVPVADAARLRDVLAERGPLLRRHRSRGLEAASPAHIRPPRRGKCHGCRRCGVPEQRLRDRAHAQR